MSINRAPAAAIFAPVAEAAPWNALSAVKSAAMFPRPSATDASNVSAAVSAASAVVIVAVVAIFTLGPTVVVFAVSDP